MGKIRLKVVGDETAEKEQKDEQKKRREEKAEKKQAKGLNMGGGQRITTVGISEEEVAQLEAGEKSSQSEQSQQSKQTKRAKRAELKSVSKRHSGNSSQVAKNTTYPLSKGLEIMRKFAKANFDETVELHINVKEKGISGVVSLPHGTGKKLRIRVADDALIAEVEKGKIDFDVLVSEPAMMPKLAKVAKILGPRGLMPNPKNGTISDKPEQVVEKLSAGQVSYKTETVAPIIHMSVGKISFEDKQLSENINTLLASIGAAQISSATLKSTMSPAILINIQ